MKLRIRQQGRGFFPQRKTLIGWTYFDAESAGEFFVCYLNIEDARAFLDEVSSGLRDNRGARQKPKDVDVVHPYP